MRRGWRGALYALLMAAALAAWWPHVAPGLRAGRDGYRARHDEAPVYTADVRGFLAACGCGGADRAGLARRHAFFSHLRAERPHLLLIDGGNVAKSADKADIARGGTGSLDGQRANVGEHLRGPLVIGQRVGQVERRQDLGPTRLGQGPTLAGRIRRRRR